MSTEAEKTKWSVEERSHNIGIRMGLARAISACDEVDLFGADECIERIRELMKGQNDRINENAKTN